MYTVIKEIRFEAAHRLVDGYPGKCAHVHGHSWVVKVECKCKDEDLNMFGMARDFGDFKTFRDWVDENLDHATLYNMRDVQLSQWLKDNNQRAFEMDCNPTSENLANFLFRKLKLMGYSDVSKVIINETCTSQATYAP